MTSSVDETQLHKIVNLDKHDFPMLWLHEYQGSEGDVCTALTISQSTDEEIAASRGMNAARIISDEIQLGYDSNGCMTDNTKATSKLRWFLKEKCNMKMDERCRSGKGKNQYTSADDRREGWENGGMRFYFKGRASDIKLRQTTVEPAEPQPDTDDENESDE